MIHSYRNNAFACVALIGQAIGGLRVLLVSAFVLAGYATAGAQDAVRIAQSTETTAKTSQASKETAPALRIHGSPAISNRLMRDLATAYLSGKRESSDAQVKGVDETSTAEGDLVLTAKDEAAMSIRIRGNGANQAFDDLSAGETDIVMSYRPVTDSEHEAFKKNASVDMRSRKAEYVIGLDGIEILANKANGLPTISRELLRAIYSKSLNDWGQAGLASAKLDGRIKAIGPGAGSNATEILRTLIMEGRPPLYQDSLDWGKGLAKLVAADAKSIGFVGMRLRGDTKSLDIDECGVTYPFDPFMIKSQDHPLTVPLYLYVNAAKPHPMRDGFMKFVMSSDGQKIIGERFVNLKVTLAGDDTSQWRMKTVGRQKPALADRHSLFQDRIKGARRLSTTFRFRFDSAKLELDSRGERDLENLVQTIKEMKIGSGRLVLLGFADALGPEDYNVTLARRRAASVASKLRAQGLQIDGNQVVAVGEDAPVGCNALPNGGDDGRGRARNRRVEVWVSKANQ